MDSTERMIKTTMLMSAMSKTATAMAYPLGVDMSDKGAKREYLDIAIDAALECAMVTKIASIDVDDESRTSPSYDLIDMCDKLKALFNGMFEGKKPAPFSTN